MERTTCDPEPSCLAGIARAHVPLQEQLFAENEVQREEVAARQPSQPKRQETQEQPHLRNLFPDQLLDLQAMGFAHFDGGLLLDMLVEAGGNVSEVVDKLLV